MSSLYFGLAVFCLFESRLLDIPPLPPNSCKLDSIHCTLDTASNSGTLALSSENTSSPKYNDDISMLILQYLISGVYCTLPGLQFGQAENDDSAFCSKLCLVYGWQARDVGSSTGGGGRAEQTGERES